ncbi:MAG TPA: multidrug efflux SMR transporter [Noviherbaspirillum sp.]|jgi:small multidrug resistance pump|uniref:DMT family transporter n=1 Tax=Noviherbaspirillum sp. TaxID=1926288 RepID=UPI002F94222C
MNTAWIMLALAIAAEVIATSALKLSNGFTRLGPSVVTVCGYAASFYLLSQILKSLEVGIVYAVWSGVGLAAVALIGVFWFGETITLLKLLGLLAILVGVILLNLAGGGH